jgi:hypothetical protein
VPRDPAGPGKQAGGTAAPARPGRRTAVPVALVLVSAATTAASLLLVPPTIGLGWDEVVYVSQLSPRAPAAFFSAPRSWGVPLLTAPVVLLTGSTLVLRLYLAVVSGLALVLACLPWIRLVPRPAAVPLAAGLYGTLWPTLFYAAEAMPNHFAALAGLAAVGWFLVGLRDGGARPLLGTGAAIAVAALMRPTDALWLSLPLLVAAMFLAVRRSGRPRAGLLAAVAGGLALGWLPWVVQAVVRDGGVLARIQRAGQIQGGTHPTWSLPELVSSLDGPLLCRPCSGEHVAWAATLWWLALPPLVVAGLVTARRSGRTAVAVLPVAAAVSAATTYVFLISYAAPRFLLPAYALLAVPVAMGLVGLVAAVGAARPRWRTGVLTLLGGALAVHLAIQAVIALHWSGSHGAMRRDYARIAAALHAAGVRPPCLLTGQEAVPIAYYARCRSVDVAGNNQNISLPALLAAGRQVPLAVLVRDGRMPPAFARGWHREPVDGLERPVRWEIYRSPPGPPSGGQPRRRTNAPSSGDGKVGTRITCARVDARVPSAGRDSARVFDIRPMARFVAARCSRSAISTAGNTRSTPSRSGGQPRTESFTNGSGPSSTDHWPPPANGLHGRSTSEPSAPASSSCRPG